MHSIVSIALVYKLLIAFNINQNLMKEEYVFSLNTYASGEFYHY